LVIFVLIKNKIPMKKIMIVFAAALTLAACNGVGESKPTQDSTAVDSTVVTADTTVVTDSATIAGTSTATAQ
jgi:uncharacterized lipoprotein YajG